MAVSDKIFLMAEMGGDFAPDKMNAGATSSL